jgi:hypothetical protein
MTDLSFLEAMFMSNLYFLSDMIEITKKVDHRKSKAEKQVEIVEYLNNISKNLPSFIYVPSDSK